MYVDIMSGKLIMKRKLDKKTEESSCIEKSEIEETSEKQRPSSSALKFDKPKEKSGEDFVIQTKSKRIRCETPPPEPEELDAPLAAQTSRPNRHLLEAIQLKMMELQNELDAFEHDVEAHEEDYLHENNDRHNRESDVVSEEEAEALGFAMCAQETILFLEREGISPNSILYTRLRDALVGRSQTDHSVHI